MFHIYLVRSKKKWRMPLPMSIVRATNDVEAIDFFWNKHRDDVGNLKKSDFVAIQILNGDENISDFSMLAINQDY